MHILYSYCTNYLVRQRGQLKVSHTSFWSLFLVFSSLLLLAPSSSTRPWSVSMSRDIFFLACSASSSRAERSSATFLSSANCQEKKASFSSLLGRIKYNSQSYTPLWSRTLVQLWSNQTTKYLSLQGDRSLRSGDFRKNSWQRRKRSAKPRRERDEMVSPFLLRLGRDFSFRAPEEPHR